LGALAKGHSGPKAVKKGSLTDTQGHKIAKSAGSVLAVDYGRARIGLAIADPETQLPRPLLTLERVNRNEDMRRLRELAREYGVRQIVVGLPLRLDGTRGEMAEEATRFAARLRKQLGLRVDMLDERLTSWEAERLLEEQSGRVLHDTRHRKKEPKAGGTSVDAVAAAVILKEYLEQQHATKTNPEHI
jgi:putative Holliday junction resolvase